jgi:hypothetical protein
MKSGHALATAVVHALIWLVESGLVNVGAIDARHARACMVAVRQTKERGTRKAASMTMQAKEAIAIATSGCLSIKRMTRTGSP